MTILFIGDIVGRPGRRFLAERLPDIRNRRGIDFVIANGENVAGGLGATPAALRELFELGIQAVTLGNHTWRKRELVSALDGFPAVARPANFPSMTPGKGAILVELPDGRRVGLVNVVGRVFMPPANCPFEAAALGVAELHQATPIVVVDVHAEATSEKIALGRHLDGRCTAVLGTHTHVQTADERVLPNGTAYITDVGMTGAFDSVLGVERAAVIESFITGIPVKFRVAKGRPGINAVIVKADDASGKALSIERLAEFETEG